MLHIQEYDSSYSPSMPVVDITLSNEAGDRYADLVAIVDSGADGSYMPLDVLRQLGCERVGYVTARGVSGIGMRMPLFGVGIKVGRIEIGDVRVMGDSQGQVILGRNILNWLLVKLDGLAQTVTIEDE